MALIALSRGLHAEIDDADLPLVADKRWWLKPSSHSQRSYAYTQILGRNMFMHRLILGVDDPNVLVDHIDMNGLNNRRSNLRLATRAQNNFNRLLPPSKTGYRGVFKRSKGFRAILRSHGTINRSAVCPSAEDAAREYDSLARKYHGDFAVLNFPDGGING